MSETNVERLDSIKESDICQAIIDLAKKKPWPDPSVDEITKDVTWLIEQAERARELEEVNDAAFLFKRHLTLEIEENKRLRGALKIIASSADPLTVKVARQALESKSDG